MVFFAVQSVVLYTTTTTHVTMMSKTAAPAASTSDSAGGDEATSRSPGKRPGRVEKGLTRTDVIKKSNSYP